MNTCTNVTPLYGLKDSPDMEDVFDRPDYYVYEGPFSPCYPAKAVDGYALGVNRGNHSNKLYFVCPWEVVSSLHAHDVPDAIINWASHFESL